MGNTTPPLGGVNKSVGNFEGAPYSEQQRPTVREGGCACERMCPEYQPGCEGDRAVAALSTPSGQMAGVGQRLWGAPPTHTEDSDTASRAAGGPQSRGLRGARLGGAWEAPPGAHCTGKKGEVPTEPQA